MSKLERKTQKIFAGALPADDNIAIFGSLAAGQKAYSDDPDKIQGAAYENGWAAAIVPDDSPALEDMNALFNLVTRQLAYIYQNGVPEWDAGTTYCIGSICSQNGVLYVSLADDNTNNAVSDATKWKRLDKDITDAIALKEDRANKKQLVNPASQTDFPSSAAVAAHVAAQIASALSTAFVREFPGITGIGVQVAATPSLPGAEGNACFTLSWDSTATQWIIAYWTFSGGAWLPAGTTPARDLHWVAVKSGAEINGYYVMGVIDSEASPPQWELLGPDISDIYTKGETDGLLAAKADGADVKALDGRVDTLETTVGGLFTEVSTDSTITGSGTPAAPLSIQTVKSALETAIAGKADASALAATDAKADQALGTANDALADAQTAHSAADLAKDAADAAQSTADAAQQALAGLATVATSGSYDDLSNKPAIPPAYTLPPAKAGTLGGVKVGSGLAVAADGTLSATGGGGGGGAIPEDAVIHIDAAGDDATGQVGNAARPFKTGQAAFEAALGYKNACYFDDTPGGGYCLLSKNATLPDGRVVSSDGNILYLFDGIFRERTCIWRSAGVMAFVNSATGMLYAFGKSGSLSIATGNPGAGSYSFASERWLQINLVSGESNRNSWLTNTGNWVPRTGDAGDSHASEHAAVVMANGAVVFYGRDNSGGDYTSQPYHTLYQSAIGAAVQDLGPVITSSYKAELRFSTLDCTAVTAKWDQLSEGVRFVVWQDGTLESYPFDAEALAIPFGDYILVVYEYDYYWKHPLLMARGNVANLWSIPVYNRDFALVDGMLYAGGDWSAVTIIDPAAAAVVSTIGGEVGNYESLMAGPPGHLWLSGWETSAIYDLSASTVLGESQVVLRFGIGEFAIDTTLTSLEAWPARILLAGAGESVSILNLSIGPYYYSPINIYGAVAGQRSLTVRVPALNDYGWYGGEICDLRLNFTNIYTWGITFKNCELILGAGNTEGCHFVDCLVQSGGTHQHYYDAFTRCRTLGAIKSAYDCSFNDCRLEHQVSAPGSYVYLYDTTLKQPIGGGPYYIDAQRCIFMSTAVFVINDSGGFVACHFKGLVSCNYPEQVSFRGCFVRANQVTDETTGQWNSPFNIY
jgi:hypothetical protein